MVHVNENRLKIIEKKRLFSKKGKKNKKATQVPGNLSYFWYTIYLLGSLNGHKHKKTGCSSVFSLACVLMNQKLVRRREFLAKTSYNILHGVSLSCSVFICSTRIRNFLSLTASLLSLTNSQQNLPTEGNNSSQYRPYTFVYYYKKRWLIWFSVCNRDSVSWCIGLKATMEIDAVTQQRWHMTEQWQ